MSGAHKESPKGEFKQVTDLFLKQVKATLATNDAYNTKHRLNPGDRGYRIATHADLTTAIGVDPNAIKNLLGGVRAGTKAKRPGRSRLVDPIARALGIRAVVTVEVQDDRVELVEIINSLPDDVVVKFAQDLRRLVRESKAD